MASGADAVIIDLEDSIAPERKEAARDAALDFLKSAGAKKARPRLLVRINGLDTGMTDADLDAIVAGAPDAILFPKAEGGATVTHLDAKLTAREAIAGLPEGAIKILAQTVESAAGLFTRRHLPRRQRAADRHDLGAGGLCRPNSAPRPTATPTASSPSPIASRARCASTARRRRKCRRSKPSTSISATRRAAPRHRDRAPRRLQRPPRHSSGAGAGDQRGVHAQSRRRSKRPRRSSPPLRRSPAPARSASTARCTTARIWCGRRRCWSG